MNLKQLESAIGGVSNPSKMPSISTGYNVSDVCNNQRSESVGGKLINTRGSSCHGCYADSNFYHMPSTRKAKARQLDAYLNNRAAWVEMFSRFLLKQKRGDYKYIRLFDSGDLLDYQQLLDFIKVAGNVQQEGIKLWLPTKQRAYIKRAKKEGVKIPDNLIIRLSAPFKNQMLIPIEGISTSTVATSEKVAEWQEKGFPAGSQLCPAPTQENECGNCRSCWDDPEINTVYEYHGSAEFDTALDKFQ